MNVMNALARITSQLGRAPGYFCCWFVGGRARYHSAFVTWVPQGVPPVRILRIASGLLGPQAFKEGLQTALGRALHFLIALSAAAVFAASRKIDFMTRRPFSRRALRCLRLSGDVLDRDAAFDCIRRTRASLIAIVTHMICVGLPISLMVPVFARASYAVCRALNVGAALYRVSDLGWLRVKTAAPEHAAFPLGFVLAPIARHFQNVPMPHRSCPAPSPVGPRAHTLPPDLNETGIRYVVTAPRFRTALSLDPIGAPREPPTSLETKYRKDCVFRIQTPFACARGLSGDNRVSAPLNLVETHRPGRLRLSPWHSPRSIRGSSEISNLNVQGG